MNKVLMGSNHTLLPRLRPSIVTNPLGAPLQTESVVLGRSGIQTANPPQVAHAHRSHKALWKIGGAIALAAGIGLTYLGIPSMSTAMHPTLSLVEFLGGLFVSAAGGTALLAGGEGGSGGWTSSDDDLLASTNAMVTTTIALNTINNMMNN